MFCAGIGIVFATLFLVFALGNPSASGLGIPRPCSPGRGAGWRVVTVGVRQTPPFDASLAELAKDREHLTSRS
jgi:hypothetical protein